MQHLADGGIGTMLLRDGRRVRSEDVGVVFRTVHLGWDRVSALQDALSHRAGELAIMECPPDSPVMGTDVHVLCTGPSGVRALSRAASESPMVLPVMLEPGGWQIGPLIATGVLSCPACLQLRGREADPHWDALQRALLDVADEALEPALSGSWAESMRVLGHAAAGIVAQQVHVLIQGRHRPATADHRITLDAATGLMTHQPTAAHPECACGTITVEPAGQSAPRSQRGRPLTVRQRAAGVDPADPADPVSAIDALAAQPLPGAPPPSPSEPGPSSPS